MSASNRLATGETDWKAIHLMLQALLEQRFQLKIHRDTKQLPVYVLTAAQNVSTLRRSSCKTVDTTPNAPPAGADVCGYSRYGMRGAEKTLDWAGATMGDFARWALPNILDRPVLDKTGLMGTFDIHLAWTPDETTRWLTGSENPDGAGTVNAPADTAATSIFTALTEQLGLKLEVTTGPVEVIVIDHVEKPDPD